MVKAYWVGKGLKKYSKIESVLLDALKDVFDENDGAWNKRDTTDPNKIIIKDLEFDNSHIGMPVGPSDEKVQKAIGKTFYSVVANKADYKPIQEILGDDTVSSDDRINRAVGMVYAAMKTNLIEFEDDTAKSKVTGNNLELNKYTKLAVGWDVDKVKLPKIDTSSINNFTNGYDIPGLQEIDENYVLVPNADANENKEVYPIIAVAYFKPEGDTRAPSANRIYICTPLDEGKEIADPFDADAFKTAAETMLKDLQTNYETSDTQVEIVDPKPDATGPFKLERPVFVSGFYLAKHQPVQVLNALTKVAASLRDEYGKKLLLAVGEGTNEGVYLTPASGVDLPDFNTLKPHKNDHTAGVVDEKVETIAKTTAQTIQQV